MTVLESVETFCGQLFDKNGQRILPDNFGNIVCDPDPRFSLKQVEIDYVKVIRRLRDAFIIGNFLSSKDFEERIQDLKLQLVRNESLANLLKGAYLPVCLPHSNIDDYGHALERSFLPAVGWSYGKCFPHKSFNNFLKDDLTGNVVVIEGSGHQILLERMRESSIAGIMFFPFQGCTVPTQREQMKSLPHSLLLAGALDIAIALVSYPEIMARGVFAPGYDCSAVMLTNTASELLYFASYDDELEFSSDDVCNYPLGNFSGGLLFIGE